MVCHYERTGRLHPVKDDRGRWHHNKDEVEALRIDREAPEDLPDEVRQKLERQKQERVEKEDEERRQKRKEEKRLERIEKEQEEQRERIRRQEKVFDTLAELLPIAGVIATALIVRLKQDGTIKEEKKDETGST